MHRFSCRTMRFFLQELWPFSALWCPALWELNGRRNFLQLNSGHGGQLHCSGVISSKSVSPVFSPSVSLQAVYQWERLMSMCFPFALVAKKSIEPPDVLEGFVPNTCLIRNPRESVQVFRIICSAPRMLRCTFSSVVFCCGRGSVDR